MNSLPKANFKFKSSNFIPSLNPDSLIFVGTILVISKVVLDNLPPFLNSYSN